MQNLRTRLFGFVFAAVVLFSVGLPLFGQDSEPAPTQNLTKALDQLRGIDSTISTLQLTASQEINTRLDQIPQVPRPETPGLKPISLETAQQSPQLVSDADKTKLVNAISDFLHHAQSKRSSFAFWAIVFIASSAILACLGGILSLLKKNIWAGVLGFVVTAVIAFSNAYPFNDLAAFYDWLSSQTEALQVECQLKQPFTIDTYDAESRQLKLLVLSEAKRPHPGNYKAQIQDVTKDVEKVKVAANTIERENAFTQGTFVARAQAKPEAQRILVKNQDSSIHLRGTLHARTDLLHSRVAHENAIREKPPQKDHLRPELKPAEKPPQN